MSKARMIVPDNLKNFLEVEGCDDFNIHRYTLTKDMQDIYDGIINNRELTQKMHDIGANYLNTTLLYGSPGTGKTTFGRYIAYTLDLDFAYINYATLLEGVFGNTARNISEIFKFMVTQECVFMLDEIDYIATSRGNESSQTGGELSRITTTLMQEFDRCKKYKVNSIILAATNRLDLVDKALLSRFSVSREVKALNNQEKEEFIIRFLKDLKVNIPYDINNIREYCATNSLLSQRNVESDLTRCVANWLMIDMPKAPIFLNHIR